MSVMSLWMPILVSAVLVFFASSVVHMFIGHHQHDHAKLPAEGAVMDSLRPYNIPPGDYLVPRAANPKEMRSPEFLERMNKGPVIIMTVAPNGRFEMTSSLAQWFVYLLVVSLLTGAIAASALRPREESHHVFHLTALVSFIAYAVALWQDSIWYRRKLGTTVRYTIDGLVYALITGGTFVWMWPK